MSRDVDNDQGDSVTQFTIEFDERPPSTTIISAIAAIENVPPIDLDITLYDHIDPCALNQLFSGERVASRQKSRISITFSVDEYSITVQNNGAITVEEQDLSNIDRK